MENEPKQIFAAITAVMKAVGAIGKGQKNPQGWMFRGIDDLYNAIQPALIENGVFIVQTVEAATHGQVKTSGGKTVEAVHLRVKHTFYAGDGSFVEAVTAGEAMDSSDRATSQAMTDAFKTAIFKTFCIPVAGEATDPDEHHHELGNGKPNGNGAAPPANSNGALATHTTNDNADIPF